MPPVSTASATSGALVSFGDLFLDNACFYAFVTAPISTISACNRVPPASTASACDRDEWGTPNKLCLFDCNVTCNVEHIQRYTFRYSEKLCFPLWGTTVRSHTLGAPRFDRKRVRSRRVGHSVTGMLRIPVLSKKYAALTNKKFWESV